MLMPEERFLTVAEVAERLRVNPVTVRRWLQSGRLAGTQIGGVKGAWRIAASEVERHQRGGEQGG